MQVNRLFEMIYILMDKKKVTAADLAERFEVSTRTIYRDVETLSSAGIPIYMTKGRGGGIQLYENFVLSKSVLSEREQNEILAGLQSMRALKIEEADPVLEKLSSLFRRDVTSWIEIDFSHWESNDTERQKFDLLKQAILGQQKIQITYQAPFKERQVRTVEPLQIAFKERAWYLRAFCLERNDYRTFKITRIRSIELLNETYTRDLPDRSISSAFEGVYTEKYILRFTKEAVIRLFDDIGETNIIEETDTHITIAMFGPKEEWIEGYILSFGPSIEVLEPSYLRELIHQRLQETLHLYDNMT